jgi:hypothetical protein
MHKDAFGRGFSLQNLCENTIHSKRRGYEPRTQVTLLTVNPPPPATESNNTRLSTATTQVRLAIAINYNATLHLTVRSKGTINP